MARRNVPEDIDIVLIDRLESPSTGAGEPSTRQVAPAIANAIFDATGKRLRRLPFTPERIRGLLG
jgi:CO/xanthine dehydrogenase Mo-binding subunit